MFYILYFYYSDISYIYKFQIVLTNYKHTVILAHASMHRVTRGPNFIIKDLPSVLVLIIATQQFV